MTIGAGHGRSSRARVLRGATRVGRRPTIGPSTTIVDSTVGDDCTVLHAYLIDSATEDGVAIGPYVHLRGSTVLRAGSKAGTFVEMKNSDIGEGAKVPHLSYLGDADRRRRDEHRRGERHRELRRHETSTATTIGANVRTGVDTTFVAPVTVGDDAVIAAGSVITEDVPAGRAGGRTRPADEHRGIRPAQGLES